MVWGVHRNSDLKIGPPKNFGEGYIWGFYMSEVFIFGAPGGENAHTGLSCGRRSIIGEIWHF